MTEKVGQASTVLKIENETVAKPKKRYGDQKAGNLFKTQSPCQKSNLKIMKVHLVLVEDTDFYMPLNLK